jgi:hypothetical protein
MPTAYAGHVWTRSHGGWCTPPTGSGCRPSTCDRGVRRRRRPERPGDDETIRAGDHTSPARRAEPRRWAPGATHILAAHAEDRPGRGDALFLPAWSRWPLTVTAGRCVLAVMLPTFEDHEVTHQARRPWRRIDHVARKAERSSALADEHTDDISVDSVRRSLLSENDPYITSSRLFHAFDR